MLRFNHEVSFTSVIIFLKIQNNSESARKLMMSQVLESKPSKIRR